MMCHICARWNGKPDENYTAKCSVDSLDHDWWDVCDDFKDIIDDDEETIEEDIPEGI